MKNLFFSLRPQQWIKNLFIFLPLLFGGKLFFVEDLLKTIAVFIIFSLAASSVYLINDILDAEKDRYHPTKRLRPVASGRISIALAAAAAMTLGLISLLLSSLFDIALGWVIAFYIFLNILYSLILKKIIIVDALCIAIFFLLRLASGSVVTDIYLSRWIITMTILLSLFIAFNKRRQEIKILKNYAVRARKVLGAYSISCIDRWVVIISSSIIISYLLYTIDPRTIKIIGSKNMFYTIPFVCYGIFRYLYLIRSTSSDGDPVNIFTGDKNLQLNIAAWIAACIVIIYL